MPTLKVPMDNDTYEALLENASQHLRPPLWHAAAILRAALVIRPLTFDRV